jgi:hypothetical protein
LQKAVKEIYPAILETSLDRGVDPCIIDKQGNNLLHMLATALCNTKIPFRISKGYEVCKLLLEQGVSPTAKNHDGKTPLGLFYTIKSKGMDKIYKLLREHIASLERMPPELFIHIAQYLEPKEICTLKLVSKALHRLCVNTDILVKIDRRTPFYKTRSPRGGYSTGLHTKTVFFIRNTPECKEHAQSCNRHIERQLRKVNDDVNLEIHTLDDLKKRLKTPARNKGQIKEILNQIWRYIRPYSALDDILYSMSNPLYMHILHKLGNSDYLKYLIHLDIGLLFL